MRCDDKTIRAQRPPNILAANAHFFQMQRPDQGDSDVLISEAYLTVSYDDARLSSKNKRGAAFRGSMSVAQRCRGQLRIQESGLTFHGFNLESGRRVKSIIPANDLIEIAYGTLPRGPYASGTRPLTVKFKSGGREYFAQIWTNRNDTRSAGEGVIWFEALSRLMAARERR